MTKLDSLKLDAAELLRLVELTERRRVKDILTIEAKKIETEISLLREKESEVVSKKTSHDSSAGKRTYTVKLNTYGWDQNDSYVKVFVTLPNIETLPSENIRCNFEDTSFELHVEELEQKNYILSIKNLHSPIDVKKCSWRVKSGMLILTLPKIKEEHWADLLRTEKKEIKSTPKLDENNMSDPSAGIMELMKQMYEDGDDNMKRTIAKAWYESREKNMNMNF